MFSETIMSYTILYLGPGAENHQQGYGASGSTVAAAGVIGPTDSVISRPDEMSESFTDEGKQSETTNV